MRAAGPGGALEEAARSGEAALLAPADACGACGGDGSSCAGCDGVPNSGAAVDRCGVCKVAAGEGGGGRADVRRQGGG